MSRHKQQILQLNTFVKTRIKPSSIEGVGVFALRDIPKGQQLYTDIAPTPYNLPYSEFRNLFPTVRDYLLERWPLIATGSAFFYPDTRIQAFLNHSDDPNYDAINDVTLRDIKSGEEVTEDYRLIAGWEIVYPWLKTDVV